MVGPDDAIRADAQYAARRASARALVAQWAIEDARDTRETGTTDDNRKVAR